MNFAYKCVLTVLQNTDGAPLLPYFNCCLIWEPTIVQYEPRTKKRFCLKQAALHQKRIRYVAVLGLKSKVNFRIHPIQPWLGLYGSRVWSCIVCLHQYRSRHFTDANYRRNADKQRTNFWIICSDTQITSSSTTDDEKNTVENCRIKYVHFKYDENVKRYIYSFWFGEFFFFCSFHRNMNGDTTASHIHLLRTTHIYATRDGELHA